MWLDEKKNVPNNKMKQKAWRNKITKKKREKKKKTNPTSIYHFLNRLNATSESKW